MKDQIEQVKTALEKVPRSYPDFASIYKEFRGKPEQQQQLLDYITANPEANAGDVLKTIIDEILPELVEDEDE